MVWGYTDPVLCRISKMKSMSFLEKCIIITFKANVELSRKFQSHQSNIVQFDAPVNQNGRGQIMPNSDNVDEMMEGLNEFPGKSCDQFHFLEMDFVPIAVSDPDEHIFVSDTEEYLVTKSETAWLLQSIVDNELIMFGLSGTKFSVRSDDIRLTVGILHRSLPVKNSSGGTLKR